MALRRGLYRTLLYGVLVIGSLICLFPFYWLLRSSLMDLSQIFVVPPKWIPSPFNFDNFRQPFEVLSFERYFLNTFIVVGGVLAGVLLSSTISAYSFARMKWTGRDKMFALLLSSMMLPFAVTLIPSFIGWQALGLVNSYAPLIVPAFFGGGAFNIFLLRQFYMSIPKELDEAVFVDGGSHFTIFSRIILPLSRSAVLVIGLFSFLGTWNDFLGPLVYLNDEVKFTLALGLQQFRGMYNAEWGVLMAASLLVLLPALIVFAIGQRYFMEGIALTGIKG
ncbi:carbohydrate ABC transporter permease [Paenibacillus sepulcri]|uniref:Carbohydrate ABC transporter permease n=1 Tax=Paenibacillus sepulcri TaxID=359917 RepID=A0ABS7BZD2_9BACL|nr:carbohydrate ABC transporter permease [Paenibacillus sepulcri]